MTIQIQFAHWAQKPSADQLVPACGIIDRDVRRNDADVQGYLDQCEPSDWLGNLDELPEFKTHAQAEAWIVDHHRGPDTCGVVAVFVTV